MKSSRTYNASFSFPELLFVVSFNYLFNENQFATCLLVLLQLDEDAVDHTADWSTRVY